MVEQLQGTVTLSGCGEIGDSIVELLLGFRPSAGNERLIRWNAGCLQLKHGRAIGCGRSRDLKRAGGQHQLVELDPCCAKWREIAAKPSMQAGFGVGLKLDNATTERRVLGNDKLSAGIDRVHEANFDGFAGLHWIMAEDFNLKTRSSDKIWAMILSKTRRFWFIGTGPILCPNEKT
jgi:hypothetical protein